MIKLNKEFLKKFTLKSLKKDFIDLINGITLKEVLIFLIFPAFITVLMLLPQAIRESLSFKVYEPSWWQFITHAFIHKDWSHLWNNLQGYLIFGLMLWLFSNRTGNKKDLLLLFALTLISLPIISSIIEFFLYPIFVPTIKTSLGSSGLISAMLGFFPTFWIYYFSKKYKQNLINTNFLNMCSGYGGLLLVIIYYPSHRNIPLLTLILAFIIVYSYRYRSNFKPLLKGILAEAENNIFFYFLTASMPLFFMVSPLLLFPVNIIQNGGGIDVVMHYLGLIYGIFLSFIYFENKLKNLTKFNN